MLNKLKKFELDLDSGVVAGVYGVDNDRYELSVHVSDLVLKPRMQNAWKNFDANLRTGQVRSSVADFRSFTKPVQFSLLLRAFAERYPSLSMEYVVVNDTAKEIAHRVLAEFERKVGRRVAYWQGRAPSWRVGIQGSEKRETVANGVVETDAEQYFLKQVFDVECMPIPTALDLSNFKYTAHNVKVSEQDVDASLDLMRQQVMRGVPCAPRAAADGDTLVLDVRVGGVGGAPEAREGVEMRIGGVLFPPEFQRLCIGKKAGDEVKYNFPVPRQLDDEALAGKVLMLRAVVREVRDTVMFDQIDEDFAGACGKSLAQLRADERTKLEKRVEELKFVAVGMQLRQFILDTQKISAPPGYVEHKARLAWKQMFNNSIPWNYAAAQSPLPKEELDVLRERILRTVSDEVIVEAVFTQYRNEHNLALTDAELAQARLDYAQVHYGAMQQVHMLGADQSDLAEVMAKDPNVATQVEAMAMSRKIIRHIFEHAPQPDASAQVSFKDFSAQINAQFKGSFAREDSGSVETVEPVGPELTPNHLNVAERSSASSKGTGSAQHKLKTPKSEGSTATATETLAAASTKKRKHSIKVAAQAAEKNESNIATNAHKTPMPSAAKQRNTKTEPTVLRHDSQKSGASATKNYANPGDDPHYAKTLKTERKTNPKGV